MDRGQGSKGRELGRPYPSFPVHVRRTPRDEPIVMCVPGNGLETPEPPHDRLHRDVTLPASRSAFDPALANLALKTGT